MVSQHQLRVLKIIYLQQSVFSLVQFLLPLIHELATLGLAYFLDFYIGLNRSGAFSKGLKHFLGSWSYSSCNFSIGKLFLRCYTYKQYDIF